MQNHKKSVCLNLSNVCQRVKHPPIALHSDRMYDVSFVFLARIGVRQRIGSDAMLPAMYQATERRQALAPGRA